MALVASVLAALYQANGDGAETTRPGHQLLMTMINPSGHWHRRGFRAAGLDRGNHYRRAGPVFVADLARGSGGKKTTSPPTDHTLVSTAKLTHDL
jgi:hypothetical protein